MLSTTLDAIKAMLKADPSIAVPERTAILAALRGQPANTATKPATEPGVEKLLSPKAAGELLSRSPRAMHLLAQQGVVRKVVLPGRQRAAGFRLSDLEALIAGGLR